MSFIGWKDTSYSTLTSPTYSWSQSRQKLVMSLILLLNYKRMETEACKYPSISLGFSSLFTAFFLSIANSVWLLLTNADPLPSAPCILMKIMGRLFIIAHQIYSPLTASSYPSHKRKNIKTAFYTWSFACTKWYLHLEGIQGNVVLLN